MHKLLARQVAKHTQIGAEIPEDMRSLFDAISSAYDGNDADRALLERSADLANNELTVINATLIADKHLLAEANVNLEKAMQEYKRVEIELRQAQKLEAIGQLASGIAHEINTPIQFVQNSIEFLGGNLDDLFCLLGDYTALMAVARDSPQFSEGLRTLLAHQEELDLVYLRDRMPKALIRAIEGLRRVSTIVGAMKDFAHPDVKGKIPSDLNRAITSTSEIVRHEFKYVADIILNLGEMPLVPCHLGEMNQVFINLIINAAHAIGDSISEQKKRGTITITTWHDEAWAHVSVKDDGSGIPESVRDKVFLPFFTTKQVGRGTGQGLAISRAVVHEKHKGTLAFATATGIGTTFEICIPLFSE